KIPRADRIIDGIRSFVKIGWLMAFHVEGAVRLGSKRRQSIAYCHRFNPRAGPDAIKGLTIKSEYLRTVRIPAVRKRNLKRQKVTGVITGINAEQASKAANHQTGANQQHEVQGDFRHHQNIAQISPTRS